MESKVNISSISSAYIQRCCQNSLSKCVYVSNSLQITQKKDNIKHTINTTHFLKLFIVTTTKAT